MCGVAKWDNQKDNEIWRDLKESTGKKVTVVRPRNEERRRVCGETNDGAARGRGQEKRKTDVKMNGQQQRRPDAECIDEIEDAQDRARWNRLTRHVDPTYKWDKKK